jgi:hypothetical protein
MSPLVLRFASWYRQDKLVTILALAVGLAAAAEAQVVVEQLTEDEAEALVAEILATGGGGTPDGMTPADRLRRRATSFRAELS